MDMLEVDPKLFITCRLCVEATGQYQIVPNVQKLIKYCYDIEVAPFDGLPQLICKECQSILSKYVLIKQSYQDKQNTLISNSKENKVLLKDADNKKEETVVNKVTEDPPQDTVISTSTSTTTFDHVESDSKNSDVDMSTSKAVTSTYVEDNNVTDVENNDGQQYKIKNNAWKANYDKSFACKFCWKTFTEKRKITKHIRKHNHLLSCYNNSVQRNCIIRLNKIDETDNVTGSKKMIVFSRNRIIQNKNAHYHIIFSLKLNEKLCDTDTTMLSDDETLHINHSNHRKRKRQQINSRSSEDIIKIDNSIIKIVENDSVINLSDTEAVISRTSKEKHISEYKNTKNSLYVYTKIKNIVDMCHKRYLKTTENTAEDNKQKPSESQLQRKLLRMGSKIINNKGFKCIGLIRYLKVRNLDVIHKTRSWIRAHSNDIKYVRIRTKLKELTDVRNICTAWTNIEEVLSANDTNDDFSEILENVLVSKLSDNEEKKNKQNQLVSTKNAPTDVEKYKKLLSANPVPNPKRLPKKALVPENVCYKKQTKSKNKNKNRPTMTSVVAGSNHLAEVNKYPVLVETLTCNTSYNTQKLNLSEAQSSNTVYNTHKINLAEEQSSDTSYNMQKINLTEAQSSNTANNTQKISLAEMLTSNTVYSTQKINIAKVSSSEIAYNTQKINLSQAQSSNTAYTLQKKKSIEAINSNIAYNTQKTNPALAQSSNVAYPMQKINLAETQSSNTADTMQITNSAEALNSNITCNTQETNPVVTQDSIVAYATQNINLGQTHSSNTAYTGINSADPLNGNITYIMQKINSAVVQSNNVTYATQKLSSAEALRSNIAYNTKKINSAVMLSTNAPYTTQKINSAVVQSSNVTYAMQKLNSAEALDSNTVCNTQTINLPKIKVKPVSVLMPENPSAINNNQVQKPTSSWNTIQTSIIPNIIIQDNGTVLCMNKNLQTLPLYVSTNNVAAVPQYTYIAPKPLQPFQMYSFNTNQSSSNPMESNSVVLDTVEFPNTRTKSPFLYFQQLLQMNKIALLEISDSLTNLSCLIKFNSVIQQESITLATLCLALHGSISHFVLKVTDVNCKIIEITKLPANWQWEVLKVFAGDIAETLLNNAQKISQSMFEVTNHFINLLKSIKFVTK